LNERLSHTAELFTHTTPSINDEVMLFTDVDEHWVLDEFAA